MTGAATDVFISYKAEDRRRLVPLVEALEAEGFSVWWDQHIGGGTNWREEIETHLDAAKVVLVVWSKLTIGPKGRFVRDEAGQAQEAGHYLPITIDNVRPPLGFREVQALDLSSWWGKRDDPRFKVLADTIRHRLEGKEIGRHALVVGKAPVSRRGLMIGGGATAVAAAAAGGFFLLRLGAANAKRIAVLPFSNLSGDAAQDYFADGIGEELRSALSRAGLEVIGRTSSEAVKDMDAKAAAAKLDAGSLLTGSVRKSTDTIRINAQLVDGRNGVEKWSEAYDRPAGDALQIQADIAQQVAGALSAALGSAAGAVELGGTTDSLAQDLVLKARSIGDSDGSLEGIKRALALSDQALDRDPRYARAWVSKGYHLVVLGSTYPTSIADMNDKFSQAEAAYDRALVIAPGLTTALLGKADLAHSRLQFRQALNEADEALRAAPHDPRTKKGAVNIFQSLRPDARTLALAEEIFRLDPLNATVLAVIGQIMKAQRRYAEAMAHFQRAHAMEPRLITAVVNMILVHLATGRDKDAAALLPKLAEDRASFHIASAIIAARRRDRAETDKNLAVIRQLYGEAASYQYGQIYAQLGEKDRAFAALDKAFEVKDPGLTEIRFDPTMEPLRSDPRYAALIRRLDFPA